MRNLTSSHYCTMSKSNKNISYGIIFHIFYKGSVTTSSFDLQLKYSILFVQNKIKKLRKLEIEKNQPRKINTYILQSSMTWIIIKLSKNLFSLENLKILQVLHTCIQFTIIKDLKCILLNFPNWFKWLCTSIRGFEINQRTYFEKTKQKKYNLTAVSSFIQIEDLCCPWFIKLKICFFSW